MKASSVNLKDNVNILFNHSTFTFILAGQVNFVQPVYLTILAFILLSYPKDHAVFSIVIEWLGHGLLCKQLSLMTHSYFLFFLY